MFIAVGIFGRNLQIFERITDMRNEGIFTSGRITGKIKKNNEIWK